MSYYKNADKADKYARDIVSGKINACLFVQQACQRHLDDLQKSKHDDFKYYFDKSAAEKICIFAGLLPHVKGKWSGSPIKLEPWQSFILCALFGWLNKSDGLRRFTELYGEIPRKNGKSVLGAIIGCYMFVVDREPGSEVYSGATTLAQAREVFRPA